MTLVFCFITGGFAAPSSILMDKQFGDRGALPRDLILKWGEHSVVFQRQSEQSCPDIL